MPPVEDGGDYRTADSIVNPCVSFLYDDHASFDLGEGLAEDGGGGAGFVEVFAEVDQQALVVVQVQDLLQFGLQADSVDGLEDAEEDRVLPRLAVAFDDAVDVTQTLGVADVVADEEAAAHGSCDF